MLRSIQPYAITAFFLAMMALLVRDHIAPMFQKGDRISVDSRIVADTWVDRDDYMSVSVGAVEIGGLHIVAERLAASDPPRYRYGAMLEVRSPLATGNLHFAALANRRLEVEQFEAVLDAPLLTRRLNLAPAGGGSAAEGAPEKEEAFRIRGIVDGGTLHMELSNKGVRRRVAQPLASPITLADSLENSFFQVMQAPGKLYRVDIVDPIFTGKATPAFVTFDGVDSEFRTALPRRGRQGEEGTFITRKFTVRVNQVESRYWVIDSNRVVRREIIVRSNPDPHAARTNTAPLFPVITMKLEPQEALTERYPLLREPFLMPDFSLGDFSSGNVLTADPGDLGLLRLFGSAATLRRDSQPTSPTAP